MYAVFRENLFLTRGHDQDDAAMREFQRVHAAQPGYVGSLNALAEDGRLLSLTLWASAEQARAAREALGPDIERLLVPLMARPSKLLAAAQVTWSDLPITQHSAAARD